MKKILLDFFLIIFLVPILLPLLIFFGLIIFFYDFKNPLYISKRVGKNSKLFNFYKFRSMVINADKNQVFSTKSDDDRITPIGKILRKYKIDETAQIINILNFTMSFVGPRPNVKFETDKYTDKEMGLLKVRPGITDLASIVFSNEAELLANSLDPNKDYEIKIRPYKSELGLIYIKYSSIINDIKILFLTFLSIFNRKLAINLIVDWMKKNNLDKNLITVVKNNI